MFIRSYFSTDTLKGPLISDSDLLFKFHSDFPLYHKVVDKKQLLTLVGYNKAVATWFRNLRSDLATLRTMPDSFKEAGYTITDWKNLEGARNLLDAANKKYSNDAQIFAKEHNLKMDSIFKSRTKMIENLPKEILISGLNVTNLPGTTQIEILLESDPVLRDNLIITEVHKLQTNLLKELKNTGKVDLSSYFE